MSTWSAPSARERWEIIQSTKSVAMMGASPNPARPSLVTRDRPGKNRTVGGVAQWLEQGLHKAKVTGSSPVAAIVCK